MEWLVQSTDDGSATLLSSLFHETYHSIHGARAESEHVFMEAGYRYAAHSFRGESPLNVLELGFGTGLNGFLVALETLRTGLPARYVSYEKYPVPPEVWHRLIPEAPDRVPESALSIAPNIVAENAPDEAALFSWIQSQPWNREVAMAHPETGEPLFFLEKRHADFEEAIFPPLTFHVVFMDAFSPETHPGAWGEALFLKLFSALLPGGVLTTYCAKGEVRRTLQRCGFRTERLPGPKGKREMLRAVRPLL